MKKPLLRRILNRWLNLLARVAPGGTTLRPWIHRTRGCKIGKGVFIGDDVYVDNEYPEVIEIGDRAQINIRVILIAHTRGPGRIIIEKDVFVGANSVVACTAGRTLRVGAGAVIGAGSVITRSIPARVYVAPEPARVLAKVEVPLTQSDSIEAFRAGLRPLDPPEKGSPRDNSL